MNYSLDDLYKLARQSDPGLQREQQTQMRVTQALQDAAQRVEKLVDTLSKTGV